MKPRVEVDKVELEKEVRRLAKVRPKYVYPRAVNKLTVGRYTIDGQPSCMMGWALKNKGVPVAILEQWDLAIENGMPTAEKNKILDEIASVIGGDGSWFRRVLGYQDDGKPWGEAVMLADQETKK